MLWRRRWDHFNGTSTGGTARVQVFFGCPSNSGNGYLNIAGQQSGMTIGSIEGDGDVFWGANRLRVGTNNRNTTFSGYLGSDGEGGGSLTKVGSGILTLQPYNGLPDNLNLMLVSGSPIKLNFGGSRCDRLFKDRRSFATARRIRRSNERRSAYRT